MRKKKIHSKFPPFQWLCLVGLSRERRQRFGGGPGGQRQVRALSRPNENQVRRCWKLLLTDSF